MYRIRRYYRCCDKNRPAYGLNVIAGDGLVDTQVWCEAHAPREIMEEARQMELKRRKPPKTPEQAQANRKSQMQNRRRTRDESLLTEGRQDVRDR